jgi:hypothetical protein
MKGALMKQQVARLFVLYFLLFSAAFHLLLNGPSSLYAQGCGVSEGPIYGHRIEEETECLDYCAPGMTCVLEACGGNGCPSGGYSHCEDSCLTSICKDHTCT